MNYDDMKLCVFNKYAYAKLRGAFSVYNIYVNMQLLKPTLDNKV